MARPEMFDVPEAAEFNGLGMNPDGIVEIQYTSPQKPETICRLKFPLKAAPKLADFLIRLLRETSVAPSDQKAPSPKKH